VVPCKVAALTDKDLQENIHASRRGHRTVKSVREWLGVGIVPQVECDDLRTGNYLVISENGGM
jgi:hypothetical protein